MQVPLLYLIQKASENSENLAYQLGFFVGSNLYAILGGLLIFAIIVIFILTKVIKHNRRSLRD